MIDPKKNRSRKRLQTKKKSLKEIQTYLERFERDDMLDDHGHMIVGARDKEPIYDDPTED